MAETNGADGQVPPRNSADRLRELGQQAAERGVFELQIRNRLGWYGRLVIRLEDAHDAALARAQAERGVERKRAEADAQLYRFFSHEVVRHGEGLEEALDTLLGRPHEKSAGWLRNIENQIPEEQVRRQQ